MDKRMLSLFERARGLKIVDSGSQVIFHDLLSDCNNEIRKHEQQIQRCLGRIDQLKLLDAMVSQVVSKYCRLQEDQNQNMKEADERKGAVVDKEEIQDEVKDEVATKPAKRGRPKSVKSA